MKRAFFTRRNAADMLYLMPIRAGAKSRFMQRVLLETQNLLLSTPNLLLSTQNILYKHKIYLFHNKSRGCVEFDAHPHTRRVFAICKVFLMEYNFLSCEVGCICKFRCKCVFLCVCICMYVYMCLCVYMYTYVCMYVYTCVYI